MSVQAIARDLGIHKDSVRRLIHSGELRAIRVGKRSFRILATDFAKFLQSRQTN
ncbi:MAG TPA: excisionase family DNA-binding protein [Nitrospirales bacterium]|nr:excisionase family DNA-binding protein [Nitrospirales bacterium]